MLSIPDLVKEMVAICIDHECLFLNYLVAEDMFPQNLLKLQCFQYKKINTQKDFLGIIEKKPSDMPMHKIGDK